MEFNRPPITDELKRQAENEAKKLIRKYGYSNIPKIISALCLENVRLVQEINDHRAARGFDPLPTYEN